MDDHAGTALHVGRLNLRIPGHDLQRGHRVAADLEQNLSRAPFPGMPRHLGALTVRIQMPAGAAETDISRAVVEQIVRSLQK